MSSGLATRTEKPPYRVPTMVEIRAVPWNGLKVASTFSGCGGSSLGYRMAGFKMLWANEFVPAAQETYRANFPETILDTRDIRTVQPEDVLAALGMQPGELDLLDGSPPCASFSTAGKRAASWGEVRKYSDTKQRTDDLFFEFLRIVRGVQPKVFVAENVSGLVKGVAKGYFLDILSAMKACGYRVQCKVLDAQWLGVPQVRKRVIFIGVREDLNRDPVYPKVLPYRYSVRDALPHILQHGTAPPHREFVEQRREIDTTFVDSARHPCPTIIAGENKGVGYVQAVRAVEDTGGAWGRGDITDRPCPRVRASGTGQLKIEECDISQYAIGKEWDRLAAGEKGKYLNFIKPHVDQPCPTVTQTGGNIGAASVVHPTERRKFTIAELKRICAFPDDFILTGTYQQQWERLGRAVPPVMMRAVADTIAREIFKC